MQSGSDILWYGRLRSAFFIMSLTVIRLDFYFVKFSLVSSFIGSNRPYRAVSVHSSNFMGAAKATSCELRLRKFLWELRAAPAAYICRGAVTKLDISIKIQYNIWGIATYILRTQNLTCRKNCVIIPKKLCGRSLPSSHGLVTVLTITGRAQNKRDASLRPHLNYYLFNHARV